MPSQDPFAEREAARYAEPIPSREFISQLLKARGGPALFAEIAEAFNLSSEDNLEALKRRLRAMERDGQLIRNRREGYGLIEKMGLVRGRVMAHRDGFGFLVPDEGGADLFLPERQMRALFDGDRIVARISGVDRRGRNEAAVVEVLERGITQFIGRFAVEAGASFVLPDNPRIRQQILIPPEHINHAKHGQIVMAELLIQPTKYSSPIGKVVEILGEHMAPGMEIDISIRSHNLPYVWPHEVQEEIKDLKPRVANKDKEGRVDLRELPLVTIDGEDARDFDDAVYCESTRQGWSLWVAIADVSHYVRPDTGLDAAAQERGNSVYFPERVIPMLPEILSNELCSLNPKVDRLCMVCEVHVTKEGEVKRYKFHEAVMNSKARLTYEEVAAILDHQDPILCKKYKKLLPHLTDLHELYQVLKKQRAERGAIDFELPETRIIFDADRKIERIVSRERNDAHRLIEECMLLANVCAAEFLVEREMPALFRNHLGPTSDKLTDLRKFLNEVGLKLGGGDNPAPKHYAKVLKQTSERPDFSLIQTVLLRSLAQAVYQSENQGHFGLAFDAYAHFTSPIRRYPDLLVHRAIKHTLAKRKSATFTYDQDKMAKLGSHCSMTERRADDATREATNWLKCEFMLDKIGQTFDGIVSGVTGFGVFVTLKSIFVDGLLHITSLKNDYYRFDPIHHRLTGERSGKVYRIGDPLQVSVVRVDLDERKIDFDLVENLKPTEPLSTKKTSKSTKSKRKPKKKAAATVAKEPTVAAPSNTPSKRRRRR
ncbi:MAG: ribonuclease R [Gammaproteobacteria bacterium]|nr:ribonuclease R [Gammaproteobacteria bacterium]